ncbi:flagellar biosynthetic protein FliO [Kushneria aurantia]|uniref:Flagellar protein n=1 Tax=Kushneria aurantia TaxID=504092 RepID=A0ABV6G108_9GAMM|nr:flagellar biosynthetic protein FliO [Kushneria aurantia]
MSNAVNDSEAGLELPSSALGGRALESAERIGNAHQTIDASSPHADSASSILSVASLGKTALALAFILLLIWGMAVLLKRLGPGRRLRGSALNIVASQSLGTREKVVVVEVEETWLVLGVSPGGISRLHEMPAKQDGVAPSREETGTSSRPPSFSDSFKHALSQRFSRRS